jgi:hypothetical protein
MIDLYREICQPVLKLGFTTHGVMGSLSRIWTTGKMYTVNSDILSGQQDKI